MAVCGFVGLGTMGFPMAGHLTENGHEVAGFNRTREVGERWVEQFPGRLARTPAEAASGADVVAICVGADDDVRDVVTGRDGALAAMHPGSVLVDHTTASAGLAEELASACAERGVGFLDAPISGGQAGAIAGTLSVMVGGDSSTVERAKPVLEAYSATITHVGPTGSGQRCKMVNQILCAGAIQGAAEALAFAQRAGLDTSRVLEAVGSGAAGSWYLANRGATMVDDEFDFGFAVDWMAKDLSIVACEADVLDVDVPLTELMSRHLARRSAEGDGRADATAIIRNYLES